MKRIVFLILIFVNFSFSQKEYIKTYYPNRKIKEEGWMINNRKTDYWFFYYENGNKKEEGHFKNNQKCNWWIFYDEKQVLTKKCEFNNNKLNGFSIIYNNKGEIIKAEKYLSGEKIKTWTSLSEFKKDNSYF